ncbi:DNA methyltransferase [Mucilaginibacter xinganensis]|uniref:DNA methylase N-4 n=1 Tax=Mucilaginibacter xinganensis TaxID=1234841 RepID=A0A223NXT0_9SPHI|nr:DNA methyltransferase [Mucilaginibacter xinganensis]ASU34371.1 DNA methylase N-4 [Mucilaginibacter xinganensis]
MTTTGYTNPKTKAYIEECIKRKIISTPKTGFQVPEGDFCEHLKPHQKDSISFAAEGGCRAIFNSWGLGKTRIQLWLAKLCIKHTGQSFIQGLPLGVVTEFYDEAEILGLKVYYVTNQAEVLKIELETGSPQIFLSNYERIREGNFDPKHFGGSSLDEGYAIRNLDTETTDYMMSEFRAIPFRWVATATPAPNDYTEILNYAHYLGIMDRGQALTRWFQRNSTTAGDLTLYEHKKYEFWLWFRSWSITIQYPSDLGHDDTGYQLPELTVNYHEVSISERTQKADRDGNVAMFANPSKGVVESSREKRDSITARVNKALEIIADSPDDHFILWHDLEDERKLLEKLLPECKSIYGSQTREKKEQLIQGFKKGEYKYCATKPTITGSGCNFQHHCHRAIFVGIGYKFKDFIQAIHRIFRFMQKYGVVIDIIHTDAEREILKDLLRKWNDHNEMVATQTELLKKYGLHGNITDDLLRTIGVEREVFEGDGFKYVYNDCVLEAQNEPDNSIDLQFSSYPFSDQYEYSCSYHDMGHNNGDSEFFEQLDWLTPEAYRTLKPGRVSVIHVKDRIRFSYQNGVGFTSLNDFSGRVVAHMEKHGFFLLGKHVITTDVVRENSSTYRLGWSEQCKDATKMGCGSPEYLLVFRKPPSDTSNAYADNPVTKSKDEYTRARWQLDAHAFWKSSGDRYLTPEELRQLDHSQIAMIWKEYDQTHIYDHEKHVAICEELDKAGKLPSSFMAVAPASTNDGVWDDINRMHTLNTTQALKKREKHVCPLQIDITRRVITRYSNKGDKVKDWFSGIGTVPLIAYELERIGEGTELNYQYWKDGQIYFKEIAHKKSVPTLFGVMGIKAGDAA